MLCSNHYKIVSLSYNGGVVILSLMNNQTDIPRLLRNLIRIGTINAVDLERGLCRVETGGNLTLPCGPFPFLVGTIRRGTGVDPGPG